MPRRLAHAPLASLAVTLGSSLALGGCLGWHGSGHRGDDAGPGLDDATISEDAGAPAEGLVDADTPGPGDDPVPPDADVGPVDAGPVDAGLVDAGDASTIVGSDAACPAEACPAEFPCTGTADDFVCLGQYAEFPMPVRRAGETFEAQRLVVDADAGTTLDQVTGLMWQRVMPALNLSQADARAYCADLAIARHTDWHLPSPHEFLTLYGAESAVDIDGRAFVGYQGTFSIWTSAPSPRAVEPMGVAIFFHEDYALHEAPVTDLHASVCVRRHEVFAHGTPSARFVTLAGGAFVHDTHTGLAWEQSLGIAATQLSWVQAADRCASLELDGEPLRVPTLAEAASLYDWSQQTQRPYPAALSGSAASVWTSTAASISGTSGRWFVHESGYIGFSDDSGTTLRGVRCVITRP